MKKNEYNSIEQIYSQIKSLKEDEVITFIKNEYREIKRIADTELEKVLNEESIQEIYTCKPQQQIEKTDKGEDYFSRLKCVGSFDNDLEFSKIDINLYNQLEQRTTLILEKEMEKFMGFCKQPIISKNNLLGRIKTLTERLQLFISSKTPDNIFTHEYQRLIENLKSFTNKEYGDDTCKAYSGVAKRFNAKEQEWYNSEKYNTLCSQLLQYNTLAFEQRQRDI